MKKVLLLIACAISIAVHAQNSGLGFNYQAVVRNADGVMLSNSDVNLRVSLYPGQEAVTPTWVETHSVRTDISGCFGITVGKGKREAVSAVLNYTDVDYSKGYYWMKIELMEGGNYREVSYSQLPSSPYAEIAHNATLFPAGLIAPFAGTKDKVPNGWLLCDGSAVSRSKYKNLYDAIGVCWGTGDGATTFNLPDLRGMFLRGVSDNSGNDPDADKRVLLNDNGGNTGNNVGSYQGDAIRNITGAFNGPEALHYTQEGAFYDTGYRGVGTKSWDLDNIIFGFDASRVVPVGGDNRPKNVYVTYIIKY